MPLETLQLDDLTWEQLTQSARDRIAGVSAGQWTLHAPVDPGITLLELFASQLEQRLYWLDQPSEARSVALLSLLGIKPKGVQIAGTVFCVSADNISGGSLPVVPKGSVFQQASSESAMQFSSVDSTQILPVDWTSVPGATQKGRRARRLIRRQAELDVRLRVGGVDRSNDLVNGRSPCLLPISGAAKETLIAFPLKTKQVESKAVPVPTDKNHVSILIDLDTPENIRAQWMPIESDDQVESSSNCDEKICESLPPARLSWHYQFVSGNEPFESNLLNQAKNVEDGTDGLRRSGIVRLKAPFIGVTKSAPSWLVIAIRAEAATYSFLPRVRQILPNAVLGYHRVSHAFPDRHSSSDSNTDPITKQIQHWRRLLGNQLDLPLTADQLPIPSSLKFSLREAQGFTEWKVTNGFTQYGPTDRVLILDRGRRRLSFGDGINGRIPIPSRTVDKKLVVDPAFKLTLEVGGGVAGNLPALQHWAVTTPDGTSAMSASNVVAAEGGKEEESIDQVAQRSKSELRRVTRAITRRDIEELARRAPDAGIKRACAALGLHPEYPCLPTPGSVTVFIVPDLPESLRRFYEQGFGDDLVALLPDQTALQIVSRILNAARLVTHEIFVRRPIYQEIGLLVEISGASADPEATSEIVTRTLHEYLHPLYGGPQGDGWPFGEPIRPSELVRVLNNAIDQELGIQSVGIEKLVGKSQSQQSPHGSFCASVCESSVGRNAPFTAPRFESCRDVSIDPHGLVALRDVQVVFTQNRTKTGGLL